jgi:hypothetical protein
VLLALMINFESYVNKMAIVLSVDEGTIPDPHQLCDDIVESLKLIKDAVPSTGLIKDNIKARPCAEIPDYKITSLICKNTVLSEQVCVLE